MADPIPPIPDVPNAPNVPNPVARLVTAWSGVGVAEFLQKLGITTWGDAAAAAACVYSMLLISEWVYKKYLLLSVRIRERRKKPPSEDTQNEGGQDG